MKKFWTVIGIIVVVVAVLYGGYRIWHHLNYAQQAASMHTAMINKPLMTAKPSMTQNGVYMMIPSKTAGTILTDSKGMTLYTYAKDTNGVSNCAAACLKAWPAYVAPSKTGTLPANISVIKRSDGTAQYAWKEMPLYYYVGDKKTGDVNGNGIGGVWSVVK